MLSQRIGLAFALAAAVSFAALPAAADPIYDPPTGGWNYFYDGDSAAAPDNAALDGTWDHDNGSDQWDGSGIGAGRPGGVSALTEGAIDFLRIQDTGDPRDYGMGDPGSNRKEYFTHQITDLPADFLDSGVTLSFRARVSNTAPLDDLHPDGGGGTAPWPSGGDGYVIHDGGKGPIGIRDADGNQIISFALAKASDSPQFSEDGLTFNTLGASAPSPDVDTGEGLLTHLLPVSNINDFHEFWVAIEPATGGLGTHRVHVFADGATTSSSFTITAGDDSDQPYSYIAMGQGSTGQTGAIDIDFVAYAAGAQAPAGGSLPAAQQTVFAPPPGGWSYMYAANPGEDLSADSLALDGTWNHDNGSDEWDGSQIGSGRPGGAMVITEGADSFLRIQDTGDPRDYGMGDPGSNRKVGLTHDLDSVVPNEYRMLDYGVTLSFRARVPTDAPLDDEHPDGGGGTAPWPADGDGYVLHDSGKGPISIRQPDGDQIISFGLAKTSDHAAISQDGLTLNSLNGTSPSGSVDTGEGTTNLLPLDVNAFEEYWVTIQADTSGGGTHRVDVYRNGSTTPDTFHVTAGTGNDQDYNYLALMQGSTGQSGAIDIDFYAVRPGVFVPGQAPVGPLVAYYNFDGNADDQSGNALHGTLQGDAGFNPDVPAQIGGGQSLILDGSGDYVDLGNPNALNFGEGDWTVAGWIKTAQTDTGTLFSNGGDGGGGVRYVLAQNEGDDNKMTITLDDNADKEQQNSLSDTNDGQWHHVAAIRQGRVTAVYVDGELEESLDLPAGYNLLATAQQPAQIGAGRQQSDGALIKALLGQIDDVGVWNVTLPHAALQGLADGTYDPLSAPTTKPLPDFLPANAILGDFLNIDMGPDGQRVEPGFVDLPGAPSDGAEGADYPATPLTAATGDVVTLTVDNVDQTGAAVGGIDWRDRGDSTNAGAPLVLVGEDHIKNDLGVIRTTLEGVPAGDYLVTAYFDDADNSQSEAIEIYLTDAQGTNVLQNVLGDASIPGDDGVDLLSTNFMDAHSAQFLMVSDGVSPLQIVFNGSLAADDEVPLSGLMIQSARVIPEPSTWALLALGAAGLLVLRRRRGAR